MKTILCSILLAFMAWGFVRQRFLTLWENWTGSQNGYVNEDGVAKLFENGSISLVITEQNDRLFTGNLTYTINGAEIVEGLAGAIVWITKPLYCRI